MPEPADQFSPTPPRTVLKAKLSSLGWVLRSHCVTHSAATVECYHCVFLQTTDMLVVYVLYVPHQHLLNVFEIVFTLRIYELAFPSGVGRQARDNFLRPLQPTKPTNQVGLSNRLKPWQIFTTIFVVTKTVCFQTKHDLFRTITAAFFFVTKPNQTKPNQT